MKKRLFLALFLPLFTLLLLFTLVNQPVSGHQSAAYYNSIFLDSFEENPDWMMKLNDNFKLSELSIPGTHDTMAVSFPVPVVDLWIRTQSMSLSSQLNRGIREFDMRLCYFNDLGGFRMYHGGIDLGTDFRHDVLDPINAFLQDHPYEVIFMGVNKDSGLIDPADNTRFLIDCGGDSAGDFANGFRDVMETYLQDIEDDEDNIDKVGQVWIPSGAPDPNNPTLGEVRGKIVILLEKKLSGLTNSDGHNWGIVVKDQSNAGSVFEIGNNWELTTRDEAYEKWDNLLSTQPITPEMRDIKHMLEAADGSTSNDIYLNALSASTAFPTICGTVSLDENSDWVKCMLSYNPVHPAFIASGHEFPYLNISSRLWTGNITQNCDGCFPINPFDPRPPIKCDQNKGNCYEDWPHRTCYFGKIVKLIDFPDPIPDLYGPTIVSRQCILYEGTNVMAMNYINSGKVTNKVGIVTADYPGPGLIEAIIGLNDPANPVPPVVDIPKPVPDPVEEGSSFHAEATFFDRNAEDTHICTVDYDDGNGPQPGDTAAIVNTCIGPPRMFDDDGDYLVTIEVTDNTNLKGTNSISIPIGNVLPAVEAGDDQTVNEGDLVSLAPATFTDPGILDTHTATIDWGDGTVDVTPGLTEPSGGADGTVAGSHIYADNDDSPYIVTVCVKDNFDYGDPETGKVCDFLVVTVNNVAPTVETPTVAPEPSDEGSPVAAWATFSDPGGAHDQPYTCEINYGDGGTDSLVVDHYGDFCDFLPSPHIYVDNDNYPVTVFVTDKDGGVGQKSTTHTVNNVAPTVVAGPNQEVNEGDVVSLAPATFTDPGILDTHTATIDWGDTTSSDGGVTEPSGSTDGTVDGSHVYADNGVYPVEVCVTDNDGGVGCDSLTVTVNNVAPTVEAGSDQEIKEGDELFLEPATFNDKGTLDTHTATIDWGDLSPEDVGVVTESPSGPPGNSNGADGSVAGSHVYVEDGLYVVTVCVEDDDGAKTCDMFNAVVENVPPIVEAGPDQTINEAETVVLAPATFTDPGILDTHTATIDWGEGTVEAGLLTEPSGETPGTVAGSHTYGDNGLYTITICVTDDDGGVGCDFFNATVNNLNPTTALDTSTAIPMDGGDVFLGRRGEEQDFSADGSDPGSDDLTFNWSFPPSANGASTIYYNDGANPDPFPSPAGIFPFNASDGNSSTFDAPGVYTVELNVEDDDGGTAADSLTLLITDNRDCTGVQAFWGQQFSGHGQTVIDPDRLQAYLDIVRFASAYFNDSNLGSLDDANAILVPGGGSNPDNRAIQEGLAAWLNFAAGGVLWNETIPHLDQTFAETIVDIEATLLNPDASKQDYNAAMQDGIKINTSKPSQAHCKEPAKKK